MQQARESLWARYRRCLTPRDRRNQARYTLLLFAWAVVLAASTALIAFDVVAPGPLGWVLSAAPSVVGFVAVLAYLRYLREADELARLIELQALAFAVCAGFVIWPIPLLLQVLGVPLGEIPNIPFLTMVVFYTAGTVRGWRRYR